MKRKKQIVTKNVYDFKTIDVECIVHLISYNNYTLF